MIHQIILRGRWYSDALTEILSTLSNTVYAYLLAKGELRADLLHVICT